MYKEIVIEPEELERLLSLSGDYGLAEDIRTACNIYRESVDQNTKENTGDRWAHLASLANVLRVGYILGQRAERRRHTHTHGSAPLSGCSASLKGGRRHD